MPTYFMALVVPVEAPTPELAFSALNNPEDPNGCGEPVFCTNPFEGTPRMAADPDFDVPTILYHGQPLTRTPSEWESPLGDPPDDLADAWDRYQHGGDVAPHELRKLDEWRSERAEEDGY
jgi:hypothetical protein